MLSYLPAGSCFINVGRDPTVDDKALKEPPGNRHIRQARLDVFEVEPLPQDNPLWSMENVLITPHLAAVPSAEIASEQVTENITHFREGQPLINPVDRRAGDKSPATGFLPRVK
jgi:glyoxylate/hydroxypyruvate reductase A